MLASSIIARRASAGDRSAVGSATGDGDGDDIFVELDWWGVSERKDIGSVVV
jgi:hypothetical protein